MRCHFCGEDPCICDEPAVIAFKKAQQEFAETHPDRRGGARLARKPEPEPESEPEKPPLRDTAASLKNQEFNPLDWIVPRYFPEGVTLLAGKPKVGKSWLALAIALAITRAKVVLDQTCQRRVVLYYALEDTRRRMKERISKIMADDPDWPGNLILDYELPPLENGGMTKLQTDLETVKPGVIIIDTLARVRGSRKGTENEYQWDTRTMALLHDFGRRSGIAIIVIHHLRKQDASDPFDTISGTHGLTGVADTICVLTRLEQDLRLIVRGRDVDEEDKIIDFDRDSGVWNVVGDYEGKDPGAVDIRNRILDVFEAHHPQALKPADVAKLLSLPAATVRGAMRRMNRDGQLQRMGYGSYHT